MDQIFQQAVVEYGPRYLQAEDQLRHGGTAAVDVVRRNLAHTDPIARLIAKCVLDWLEGRGQPYQAALDYLDRLPERMAQTAARVPSPTGVAGYLNLHFGSQVADVLAMRLVKGSDWPHWRVAGVLFHLRDQKVFSTTSAIIRFAAETTNDAWMDLALEALTAIADPELAEKVAAERQRLAVLNKPMPPRLAALEVP